MDPRRVAGAERADGRCAGVARYGDLFAFTAGQAMFDAMVEVAQSNSILILNTQVTV